jgi:hypothetical protein
MWLDEVHALEKFVDGYRGVRTNPREGQKTSLKLVIRNYR